MNALWGYTVRIYVMVGVSWNNFRSAQSACPGVCVLLDWCLMGMATVYLKICVPVFTTELRINLGKAFPLTVIHGRYLSLFVIFGGIILNNMLYLLLTAFVMRENGSAPITSAAGHAAFMETAIIRRLMTKDTSLVEAVNTASFRYDGSILIINIIIIYMISKAATFASVSPSLCETWNCKLLYLLIFVSIW